MRRAAVAFVLVAIIAGSGAAQGRPSSATVGQSAARPVGSLPSGPLGLSPSASSLPTGVVIDGIAVHIEDDIILETEVAELAAVQKLLDGKSRSRADLVNELVDQWVVRHEAETSNFPGPTETEVQGAFDRLAAKFPSAAAFEVRLRSLGMDDSIVKRQLRGQLYLSSFIEYRFRPGIEITDKEVTEYYQNEMEAELKKQNQPVPPLTRVANDIRELLTEREVSRRADEWIADARSRLRIDITPGGGGK
jgi:peptidyl-prolyl cis-trans isomerase SurA